MSQENVELVRAQLRAFAEGGFDASRDLIHPDFEMSQLPLHPEAGTTYRGWRTAVKSMQAWVDTFEEFRWDAEEFIDAGDRVVAVIREQGRGRGGGVDLNHRFGALYTIRDCKIARLQWFSDKETALEAAGLLDG